MFLTILDVVLILIMLVSGFLAMMRGFTREVLSIASWGAAAGAALFAYNSSLRGWVRGEFSSNIVADAVLVIGVFFVTLIVVGLLTARLSDAILDSRIGALDRSAGFLFGLFRGLVIVVIGYLFFSWLVDENGQPNWIKHAKSKPLLHSTGNWILSQLPDDPEATLQQIRQKRNQGDTAEQPQEDEVPTKPVAPSTTDKQGINNLIENTKPQGAGQ